MCEIFEVICKLPSIKRKEKDEEYHAIEQDH